MRAVSPRRARQQRARTAQNRRLARRAGGLCELGFAPECATYGVEPHHVLKQSQHTYSGDVSEDGLVLWSCRPCNRDVELHPIEAHAVGVSIERWEYERFMEWALERGVGVPLDYLGRVLGLARRNDRSFAEAFADVRAAYKRLVTL